MGFNINEEIQVNKTGKIEKIEFIEKISDVNIIYTHEGNSYAEKQVSPLSEIQMNSIVKDILSNPNLFLKRRETIVAFDNWAKGVLREEKKMKKLQFIENKRKPFLFRIKKKLESWF